MYSTRSRPSNDSSYDNGRSYENNDNNDKNRIVAIVLITIMISYTKEIIGVITML